MSKLARTGASRTNICRNLHRLIDKSGVKFPVKIAVVPVRIRLRKPKPHVETLDWPMIRPSDWVRSLINQNPPILLGGHELEDERWKPMLASFWEQYRYINPQHPIYALPNIDRSTVLPYAHHGDEGRGLPGKPFLVESFQPIIGVNGINSTNESGQRAGSYLN